MSTHCDLPVESQLEALNAVYHASLPNKLEELQDAVTGMLQLEWGEDARQSLVRVAALSHKIAGAAAMFGFGGVSESAQTLDELCSSLLANGENPNMSTREHEIRELLHRMKSAAIAPDCRNDPAPQASVEATNDSDRHLFFIDDGEGLSAAWLKKVEPLGYRIRIVRDNDDLLPEIRRNAPMAVILPTTGPKWQALCKSISTQNQTMPNSKVCLVCISARDDFDCRLSAMRAGADAFFTEHLPLDQFLREVEEKSDQVTFDPHRILIVEDDKPQAEHYSAALDGPGNRVRVVQDPRKVQFHITNFQPELILVDLSLADCSGLELARMIWQTKAGKDLPVLFLSSGPEFNRDLQRLGLSDELFLKKPVNLDELRMRVLGQLMNARKGAPSPSRACLIQALGNRTILDRLHKSLGWEDAPLPAAVPAPKAATKKVPTVLVVDDDRMIVELISTKLEDQGIKVRRAASGEKGYHMALKTNPDCIISDYQMPQGSADYLLSRLKSNAGTRNIPVLIMTAKTIGGRKDYALEREMLGRHGAVSYLNKPIDWDMLFAELRSHMTF